VFAQRLWFKPSERGGFPERKVVVKGPGMEKPKQAKRAKGAKRGRRGGKGLKNKNVDLVITIPNRLAEAALGAAHVQQWRACCLLGMQVPVADAVARDARDARVARDARDAKVARVARDARVEAARRSTSAASRTRPSTSTAKL
jgi:hypothetical protein